MKNNTNWKKTHLPAEDYKSNWDWCVDHSEYHFTDKKDEVGEWFDIIGTFDGDWHDDLEKFKKESSPINWETRKFYAGSDDVSPMLEQEEYDIIKGGGNPKKLQLCNKVTDFSDYPQLTKMIDFLGLEGGDDEFKARGHMQYTGQMFNMHIDKLWDQCPEDPERVARFIIFLDDWRPGQFLMYGNLFHEWSAGEVVTFDWPNVPHATANASNHPRPALVITGLKSDKTRELLANPGKHNVFKV